VVLEALLFLSPPTCTRIWTNILLTYRHWCALPAQRALVITHPPYRLGFPDTWFFKKVKLTFLNMSFTVWLFSDFASTPFTCLLVLSINDAEPLATTKNRQTNSIKVHFDEAL
jgi:hypothetical protein